MKNTNIAFIAVLATIFLTGTASTSKAQAPTCAELGYNKTSSQCGANKVIKCPTDTSKVFCVEKCPSVSINKYIEVCTKYCADDPNVCVEKRDMTCSEYITANNGEKIADGATVSGTKTKNLYLMGSAKDYTGYGNYLKLVNVIVYDASEIAACKAEGAKEASFDISYLSIEMYAAFFVKTKINSVSFQPSSPWSAYFYKDSNVRVNFYANSVWGTQLNLYFEGGYNSEETIITKNKVNIRCEGEGSSSWYPAQCGVSIDNYNADVLYCVERVGTNVEGSVSCSGYSEDTGSCKESYEACSWY